MSVAVQRGSEVRDVPPEIQNASTLTSSQIEALARLGRDISRLQGCPQDIEWTIAEEKIYILQTRPVTKLPPPDESPEIIFDNSNIQESYCGVTLPLTFSFASEAYCDVYSQLMNLMGFSQAEIQNHHKRHENMLGIHQGRVFYNINSWYEGLKTLPSFSRNKEDMERMMGLTEPVKFVKDEVLGLIEKIKMSFKMLPTLWRLLRAFSKIDSRAAQFHEVFHRAYSSFDRKKFHELETDEIYKLIEEARSSFLKNWSTPIINDFFVMMMNGKAFRALKKIKMESELNHLLAGEVDIASTEPTKVLLRITEKIRRRPEIISLFETLEGPVLLRALQTMSPDIYQDCLNYINKFGDRCVGELKLESISLREDPTFMFSLIKGYLRKTEANTGFWDLSAFEKHEKTLRAESEKKVFGAFSKFLLFFFKRTIKKLRKAIRYRENMRMERTRVFGLFRALYLELGKRFASLDLIDDERDVFYLTTDEIEKYLMGRSVNSNLKSVISLRKTEYSAYAETEPPHRFTAAYPASKPQIFSEDPKLAGQRDQQILKGLPCYPGVVTGSTRLLLTPTQDLDLQQKILCTMRTDPGWAPLFAHLKGLIVERGSTLSHSAIVAREMGLPAIVGVPNVTKILRDGELVEINGQSGTITRLQLSEIPSDLCTKDDRPVFSRHDKARKEINEINS